MGNLITSNIPIGIQERASMLRSAFELRQPSTGLKKLSCDVVFGSPAADCRGTGVCKISALATLPPFIAKRKSCQSAPGILYPLSGGGVSLVIAREMMCIKLLRSQFRGGVLIIQEPYPLPTDIIMALSLKIKELKPGNYLIEEEAGFFRIDFQ